MPYNLVTYYTQSFGNERIGVFLENCLPYNTIAMEKAQQTIQIIAQKESGYELINDIPKNQGVIQNWLNKDGILITSLTTSKGDVGFEFANAGEGSILMEANRNLGLPTSHLEKILEKSKRFAQLPELSHSI